jgi:hypothetical protein
MSSDLKNGDVVLLVGTKRGLFVLRSSDRRTWNVSEPTLPGATVYNAVLDQRQSQRIFAADNGVFFGAFVRYSDDFGATWKEPKQGIQFSEDSGLTLKNIWIVQPGRQSQPDTVYAGVDPASLWISTDGGETWNVEPNLQNHPTRDRWEPGAGGLCLHSIVPDYSNPDRMWIGISAVGCIRTENNAKTWEFANKNTRAGFLPDPYPEFGQCIHRLLQHPTKPDHLYQQNHCGIYRSENAGRDWLDIQQDLPSEFGFPIAVDHHNPETIFVIVEDGMSRANVGDHFVVYRSENAGASWERMTKGLPEGNQVSLGVLRHGMCSDGLEECGVYVGTNTGQLFASPDRGESWGLIADFLPPIYSVTAAVVGRA